jgi:hypothetical protein
VEVAGLAALLRPAEGVEPVDLQRLLEEAGWLGFQRTAEEAGWLGFQHTAEEAGLAGFAMATENWTLHSPCCLPEGVLD